MGETFADSTNVDPIVRLQAVLAGLAKNTVPPRLSPLCNPELLVCWSGNRPRPNIPGQTDEATCRVKLQQSLNDAAADYPDCREVLQRLEIEQVSIDFACLADHVEERIYFVARGTDRNVNPLTWPRDWRNNISLLFDNAPARHSEVARDFAAVRRRYPRYSCYGSGHSLGGAVIFHLAKCNDADALRRFVRVDLFSLPVSPLNVSQPCLYSTDMHVHCVRGDVVSFGVLGLCPSWGELHWHPPKPEVPDLHRLLHYLPEAVAAPVPLTNAISVPADAEAAAAAFDVAAARAGFCGDSAKSNGAVGASSCDGRRTSAASTDAARTGCRATAVNDDEPLERRSPQPRDADGNAHGDGKKNAAEPFERANTSSGSQAAPRDGWMAQWVNILTIFVNCAGVGGGRRGGGEPDGTFLPRRAVAISDSESDDMSFGESETDGGEGCQKYVNTGNDSGRHGSAEKLPAG